MSAFELIRQVALKLDDASLGQGELIRARAAAYRALADDLWLAYRELEEMVDVAWEVVNNYEPYEENATDGVKDDPLSRAMVELHQVHLRCFFPDKDGRA